MKVEDWDSYVTDTMRPVPDGLSLLDCYRSGILVWTGDENAIVEHEPNGYEKVLGHADRSKFMVDYPRRSVILQRDKPARLIGIGSSICCFNTQERVRSKKAVQIRLIIPPHHKKVVRTGSLDMGGIQIHAKRNPRDVNLEIMAEQLRRANKKIDTNLDGLISKAYEDAMVRILEKNRT